MRNVGESIKDKRIRFKKDLQRVFLERIKEKSGLTWVILAKKLNLCNHTISFDWRSGKSTVPYNLAKEILEKYPFETWKNIESDWIEKILPADWRQNKLAEKIKKNIKVPQKSEELAELLGVILGDGHLERKTLTITGNSYEKAHYLYLSKRIRELFALNSIIFKLKDKNAIQLKVYSIELINFLKSNSMVLGNKIDNKASFPKWIFENEKFIFGALRGLFDTDGGIYLKQKRYKRGIIEFQTSSQVIRENIFQLLYISGFRASKSANNIRIQNQEEVHKFFKLIGSSNPKNIVRYNYFIKEGFIPLKEKLKKDIKQLKIERPFKATLV